jgi:hypothetical protein
VHVPFKGGSLSTAAVVAGEVDFSFANMTDALPQIQAGTVRGLAVTSLARSPYFPDLPSVHETVVADFLVETWNGIMAPAKTLEPIIRKLAEILIRMADDPMEKETMRKAQHGQDHFEQFRTDRAEIAQWKPLIRRSRRRNSPAHAPPRSVGARGKNHPSAVRRAGPVLPPYRPLAGGLVIRSAAIDAGMAVLHRMTPSTSRCRRRRRSQSEALDRVAPAPFARVAAYQVMMTMSALAPGASRPMSSRPTECAPPRVAASNTCAAVAAFRLRLATLPK